jgi:hypothetical protein
LFQKVCVSVPAQLGIGTVGVSISILNGKEVIKALQLSESNKTAVKFPLPIPNPLIVQRTSPDK